MKPNRKPTFPIIHEDVGQELIEMINEFNEVPWSEPEEILREVGL